MDIKKLWNEWFALPSPSEIAEREGEKHSRILAEISAKDEAEEKEHALQLKRAVREASENYYQALAEMRSAKVILDTANEQLNASR
jgi:hypothetical protein